MHRQGQAAPPDEFGVMVSVATPRQRCRGGQFVAQVAALPGNPYDGHTLAKVLPAITEQIGASLIRVLTDRGYRGHNAPRTPGLRVSLAGQKRGLTDQIKRELRRRAAVEPVIGHLKDGHRMDRNHLAGRQGDAINPILAAAGYNFKLLLDWLGRVLCVLIQARRCHAICNYGAYRAV